MTMVWYLTPLLVSIVLTSCARFYNMPPAETGVVEEAGDIQVAGQQGSKGRSLSAAVGFHNLQKREFDADYLPLDSAEADSLIAVGRVVRGVDLCLYGLFQWYSHSHSPKDESDLRDQVEYNFGSGIAIVRYERDNEGRRPWPGLTGLIRGSVSIGVGYGRIASEYTRVESELPWKHSPRAIDADYLRPWLQLQSGLSLPLLSFLEVEAGMEFRLSVPFFLEQRLSDPDLATTAILLEYGIFGRIQLFDVLAVEGVIGSELIQATFAFLAGDWAYDYGVLGVRLTIQ